MESSEESIFYAYEDAANLAEKTYYQAEIAADGAYEAALQAADNAQEAASTALTLSTLQSQYGAYFTALEDACSALTNTTVGSYYEAVVDSVQTQFTAENNADSTYKASTALKSSTFAQNVVDITTSFFTTVLDAIFDSGERASTATQQDAAVLAKKAEIDAVVALQQAVVAANYSKEKTITESAADAVERQLAFTKKYGVYELNHYWYPGSIDVSMPFDYSAYKGLYDRVGVSSSPSGVSLGANSANILDNLSIMHMASPFPPATNGAWTEFNPLNANICAVQVNKANLKFESDVAAAYGTYVDDYSGAIRNETVAALAKARIEYEDELNWESALNNAELAAREAAFSDYVSDLQDSDTTSELLDYADSILNSELNCDSDLADAYGDLQIENRENIRDSVTSSNGRHGVYHTGISWAIQLKSLRNQYYTATSDAAADYFDDVSTSLTAYQESALDFQANLALGSFNVAKSQSQNAFSSALDYALGEFDASQTWRLAELDASITQASSNAGKEAELALARYSAYSASVEAPLSAALAALAAVDFEESGCVAALAAANSAFTAAAEDAASADAALAQANASELEEEATLNETAYNEALADALSAFKDALHDVWNSSFLQNLLADAEVKDLFLQTANEEKTAIESAYADYRADVFSSYNAAVDDLNTIERIAAYHQERVDMGAVVPADVFFDLDNPNFEYQICFMFYRGNANRFAERIDQANRNASSGRFSSRGRFSQSQRQPVFRPRRARL